MPWRSSWKLVALALVAWPLLAIDRLSLSVAYAADQAAVRLE